MGSLSTLADIILACKGNHQRGINFIESSKQERRVTYDQFYKKAHYVLHNLKNMGVAQGDEVVFQVEDNETFVHVFWGCILGGIRPVPISLGNNTQIREKLFKVWEVLGNPYLLTDGAQLKVLENHSESYGLHETFEKMKSSVVEIETVLREEQMAESEPCSPEDLAFIQFSSGSTGTPKGVMLSHENVMTNIKAITKGMESTGEDRALSWMPLTHDMGLIGFLLAPMFQGVDLHLMSTALFIRRPSLWMQKAHEYRATVLSSPNFGYRYYLTRFKAKENEGLDLSAVRLIFNGAEPISVRNVNEFLDHMEPYKLQRNAIFNVYGLAEASLAVSFPKVLEPLNYICADRRCLGIGETITQVSEVDVHCARIVEVGQPIPDCLVEIRTEDGALCPEGVVGHIQISGKSVTKGYYGDDALNCGSFAEGWFNTGDLGFMYQGRLYVTGRVKDILFINGQNHYAHDIETVLCELEQFSEGQVVAAGVFDKQLEKEQFIIFVYHKGALDQFPEVHEYVRKQIQNTIGTVPDYIIPVKKIPKTTSGKIQRYELVNSFELGEYSEVLAELKGLMPEENAFDFENPQTETETAIAQLVKTVLNMEQVDVDRNLTEFVEGSLQLISIQSEIEDLYPGQVRLSDLFAYPSIRELAAYIDRGGQEGLKSIPLPGSFFAVRPGQEEWSRFEVRLGGGLVQSVHRFAVEHGVEPFAVLAYGYLVLFQKVTQLEEVVVQGLQAKETDILPLDGSAVKGLTPEEGIRWFQQYLKTSGLRGTPAEALAEQRIAKGTRGIVPLIAEGSSGADNGFKGVFDIIMQVSFEKDSISLYWTLNGLRLNKEKIKDMSNGFVNLVQLIVG